MKRKTIKSNSLVHICISNDVMRKTNFDKFVEKSINGYHVYPLSRYMKILNKGNLLFADKNC